MSTISRVSAFAPASMGNLGVGFDIMGLALREPGDIACAERCDAPGAVLAAIEGEGGALPLDPAQNTATVAANSVLRRIGAPGGVRITLHKRLPAGSGLGSSAASAVAAAVAVNALFGEPLSRAELLAPCMDGEAVASGGYHPDNVGPSLLGGITLITGAASRATAHIRRLPVPPDMHLALVTPAVVVPTAMARAVLPQAVTLRQMVAQTGAVARLVDALHRGDLATVAEAMESDSVIEPARAHLMPLLADARAAARRAGALAVVISGAGPTLCAVCDSQAAAQKVAAAMGALYDDAGIGNTTRHTRVSEEGARLL